MKKIIYLITTILFLASSCSEDILDIEPKAVLSSETLDNPEAAEGLVIASYALLDNVFNDGLFPPISAIFYPASNWSYSDVRSDDAYKGGGGTGDIGELNSIELGNIFTTNSLIFRKWQVLYFAVSRCNKALQALNSLTTEQFPLKETRIAEVKALRGHYYFELKRHFFTYPYIDETVELGQEGTIPNNLSSEELWQRIIDDFQSAAAVLPDVQPEIGRVNKPMANAYLAKVFMYTGRFQEAIQQADLVINSGQYRLLDNLEDLYSSPETEHAGEFIWAIETSVMDGGTLGGNLNWGDLLTSPPGPAYGGGDGFHRPSQNLFNAYKVDANGLPLFDTFNDADMAPEDTTTPIDPRLDHAIGRPGIPWKDFIGEVYGANWIREGSTYGALSKKKNLISPNSPLRAAEGFPWARGAFNYPIIKYSDVLLWKAEALIETGGDLEEARNLINMIRERAMNSPVVMTLDGSGPAANYQIGLYPSTGWTQDFARQALRFERRLELALEGHRFYDLVRWGTADEVINTYYDTESADRPYLSTGTFVSNRHEYLPIPQDEIDRSAGVLEQNEFYR